MNSVFSVFKSNSGNGSGTNGVSSGNTSSSSATAVNSSNTHNHNNNHHHHNGANNHNGHHTGNNMDIGCNTKLPPTIKYVGKKITHDSSYENLRHIREIESSTKMSSFIDIAAAAAAAAADDDDDEDTTSSCSNHTIRLNKRCVTPVVVSSAVIELALDEDDLDDGLDDDTVNDDGNDDHRVDNNLDTVDCAAGSSASPLRYGQQRRTVAAAAQSYHCARQAADGAASIDDSHAIHTAEHAVPQQQQQQHNGKAISASESNLCDGDAFETINSRQQSMLSSSSISSNPASSCSSLRGFPNGSNMTTTQSQSQNHHHKSPAHESATNTPPATVTAVTSPKCLAAAGHAPIIVANSRGQSESNLSSATKTTNRFQKRLSLSGFTNNSMPSVHGRPNTAAASNVGVNGVGVTTQNGCGNGGEVKRTRLSTHQRNLSLDFR